MEALLKLKAQQAQQPVENLEHETANMNISDGNSPFGPPGKYH